MKFFRLAYLPLLLASFVACDFGSKEESPEIARLRKENEALKAQLAEPKEPVSEKKAAPKQDSITYETVKAMILEIEANLVEIQKEEKKIEELKEENPETYNEQELVEHIVSIHALSEANKEKFYYLNKQLKKQDGSVKMSSDKVNELQSEVDDLESEIQNSEKTVETLKRENEYLAKDIEMLENTIEEVYDSGQEFFEESDRAFIAIGTQAFFEESGVLISQGGFMGVGSVEVVNPDFDQTVFSEIEKSLTEEIFLDTEILSLASSHPSSTYKITKEDKGYLLRIVDMNNFWRQSRHLIVITEK